MKILFTAPRFHTNQVPIVKGFTSKGHEVKYFVVFVGKTEDHGLCEPTVLKPSRNTIREKKKLERSKTESEVESIMSGRFVPDTKALSALFMDYMPDLVICRERTPLTLCVYKLCVQTSTPCILYDQEPYMHGAASPHMRKSEIVHGLEKRSLIRRILLRLESKLIMDKRMLKKIRNSIGFPTVRITPVHLSNSSDVITGARPDPHSYFVPLVCDPPQSIESRTCCPEGITRVLCVGKYREYKSLPLLVDAIFRMKNREKVTVTIVGQAVSRDELEHYQWLKNYIEGKGLGEKIHLEKNVSHTQISSVYLANDLFILPTKKEHASIALLEAMAHGLAVISTDNNGTATYIREGVCGYTFATGDAEQLSQRIEQILDRADIREMGMAAYKHMLKLYSFEQYFACLAHVVKYEFGRVIS